MNTLDETTIRDCVDWDKEIVIEQVWMALHGMVATSLVEQLVTDVMQKYEGALIKTYIPILVHKEVVDRLRTVPSVTPSEVKS